MQLRRYESTPAASCPLLLYHHIVSLSSSIPLFVSLVPVCLHPFIHPLMPFFVFLLTLFLRTTTLYCFNPADLKKLEYDDKLNKPSLESD